MNPQEVSNVLQTTGGWGLAALLMTAILFLVRYIMKLVDDRNNREKEQNQKLLEMMEKRIETDIKHEMAFNNLSRTIDTLVSRM